MSESLQSRVIQSLLDQIDALKAEQALLKGKPCMFYPIGVQGQPWGAKEKAEWLSRQTIKRSYKEEVLTKIDALRGDFDVSQYGSLSHDPERYPLFAVRTKNWEASKPSILVTGGVHGYETSGVQGALLFLKTKAAEYSATFNLLVLPCVSPWGYEVIQRWNAQALDPNRSFNHGDPAARTEESGAVIALLASLGSGAGGTAGMQWTAHIDLHETTDTDESEFRPAKAARDGTPFDPDTIPDGFYLVQDTERPQEAWHTAMIDAVREVTHIAPPDGKGLIIGEPITQEGVIGYPNKALFLCAGVTNATYATTTEVYPDSPSADDETCNRAQVACLVGALDHIAARL